MSQPWTSICRARGGLRVFRSPSPLPSPQGRGRMADSASTNLARREWSKDGVRVSLSPGERAGVRGNGSPDIPAAPVSEYATLVQSLKLTPRPWQEPSSVDGRRRRMRYSSASIYWAQGGLRVFRSPSPLPSPQRRGRMADSASTNLARQEYSKDGVRVSLSPGERAGVRGNRPSSKLKPLRLSTSTARNGCAPSGLMYFSLYS